MKCLALGIKKGQSYPEKVRKFCLELHFHRPAAYRYIRRVFANHLPHERTLGMWYQVSDINQGNGICAEAFKRLEHIAEETEGNNQLICSLIMDEVYIRKEILHCKETSTYVGYVTYGSSLNPSTEEDNESNETDSDEEEEDELPCANQAIVFMLYGLETNFKLPIAYEFIKNINAYQRANLVATIIKKVTESGIRISNLTFDGLPANNTMSQLLGANLDINSNDFKPYFINPTDGNKIYIIKDPNHMQKLIRNTLAKNEVLFHEKNERIQWKHFENLEQLGRDKQFLTHKLTKRHIQYKKSIMNVQISRQTLSEPVAKSMQYLQDNNFPKFENCQPTICFIRMMDKLASICNSSDTNETDPYKRALCAENARIVKSFLSECSVYLKNLGIIDAKTGKKISIMKSRRKIGFTGMIISATSMQLMYDEYVEGGLMKSFTTYSTSQDHLEAFFGHIRARQGANDNPNVIEFKAAWRKLLCGNLNIFHSTKSNVSILNKTSMEPFTNIYTVSSGRIKFNEMDKQKIREEAHENRISIQEKLQKLRLTECSSKDSELIKATIAFSAKAIEEKIEFGYQFSCEPCTHIFNECSKMVNCFSKANLEPPCTSTFQICEITDRFLMLHNPSNAGKYDFNTLYLLLFGEFNYETMYTQCEHLRENENHKHYLVKCIVDEYVQAKISQLSQQRTLNEYGQIVRSANTKATHFAGQ